MEYKELNDVLRKRFPSLKTIIDAEMDTFECYIPGPHVLYGNVLNPYISGLLRMPNKSDEISNVFLFYEELAQSDDSEVRNLLQATLLEYLWDEHIIFCRAIKHMLPETKKINESIGTYLKKPYPSDEYAVVKDR